MYPDVKGRAAAHMMTFRVRLRVLALVDSVQEGPLAEQPADCVARISLLLPVLSSVSPEDARSARGALWWYSSASLGSDPTLARLKNPFSRNQAGDRQLGDIIEMWQAVAQQAGTHFQRGSTTTTAGETTAENIFKHIVEALEHLAAQNSGSIVPEVPAAADTSQEVTWLLVLGSTPDIVQAGPYYHALQRLLEEAAKTKRGITRICWIDRGANSDAADAGTAQFVKLLSVACPDPELVPAPQPDHAQLLPGSQGRTACEVPLRQRGVVRLALRDVVAGDVWSLLPAFHHATPAAAREVLRGNRWSGDRSLEPRSFITRAEWLNSERKTTFMEVVFEALRPVFRHGKRKGKIGPTAADEVTAGAATLGAARASTLSQQTEAALPSSARAEPGPAAAAAASAAAAAGAAAAAEPQRESPASSQPPSTVLPDERAARVHWSRPSGPNNAAPTSAHVQGASEAGKDAAGLALGVKAQRAAAVAAAGAGPSSQHPVAEPVVVPITLALPFRLPGPRLTDRQIDIKLDALDLLRSADSAALEICSDAAAGIRPSSFADLYRAAEKPCAALVSSLSRCAQTSVAEAGHHLEAGGRASRFVHVAPSANIKATRAKVWCLVKTWLSDTTAVYASVGADLKRFTTKAALQRLRLMRLLYRLCQCLHIIYHLDFNLKAQQEEYATILNEALSEPKYLLQSVAQEGQKTGAAAAAAAAGIPAASCMVQPAVAGSEKCCAWTIVKDQTLHFLSWTLPALRHRLAVVLEGVSEEDFESYGEGGWGWHTDFGSDNYCCSSSFGPPSSAARALAGGSKGAQRRRLPLREQASAHGGTGLARDSKGKGWAARLQEGDRPQRLELRANLRARMNRMVIMKHVSRALTHAAATARLNAKDGMGSQGRPRLPSQCGIAARAGGRAAVAGGKGLRHHCDGTRRALDMGNDDGTTGAGTSKAGASTVGTPRAAAAASLVVDDLDEVLGATPEPLAPPGRRRLAPGALPGMNLAAGFDDAISRGNKAASGALFGEAAQKRSAKPAARAAPPQPAALSGDPKALPSGRSVGAQHGGTGGSGGGCDARLDAPPEDDAGGSSPAWPSPPASPPQAGCSPPGRVDAQHSLPMSDDDEDEHDVDPCGALPDGRDLAAFDTSSDGCSSDEEMPAAAAAAAAHPLQVATPAAATAAVGHDHANAATLPLSVPHAVSAAALDQAPAALRQVPPTSHASQTAAVATGPAEADEAPDQVSAPSAMAGPKHKLLRSVVVPCPGGHSAKQVSAAGAPHALCSVAISVRGADMAAPLGVAQKKATAARCLEPQTGCGGSTAAVPFAAAPTARGVPVSAAAACSVPPRLLPFTLDARDNSLASTAAGLRPGAAPSPASPAQAPAAHAAAASAGAAGGCVEEGGPPAALAGQGTATPAGSTAPPGSRSSGRKRDRGATGSGSQEQDAAAAAAATAAAHRGAAQQRRMVDTASPADAAAAEAVGAARAAELEAATTHNEHVCVSSPLPAPPSAALKPGYGCGKCKDTPRGCGACRSPIVHLWLKARRYTGGTRPSWEDTSRLKAWEADINPRTQGAAARTPRQADSLARNASAASAGTASGQTPQLVKSQPGAPRVQDDAAAPLGTLALPAASPRPKAGRPAAQGVARVEAHSVTTRPQDGALLGAGGSSAAHVSAELCDVRDATAAAAPPRLPAASEPLAQQPPTPGWADEADLATAVDGSGNDGSGADCKRRRHRKRSNHKNKRKAAAAAAAIAAPGTAQLGAAEADFVPVRAMSPLPVQKAQPEPICVRAEGEALGSDNWRSLGAPQVDAAAAAATSNQRHKQAALGAAQPVKKHKRNFTGAASGAGAAGCTTWTESSRGQVWVQERRR